MVQGPKGIMIHEADFLYYVQDGCANCSDNISVHEADLLVWTRDGQPVCPDCQDMLGMDSVSYGWID